MCANAAVATGFVSTYSIFNWDVVKNYATEEELATGIACGLF